jgi:hypothetical protein
LSCGGSGHHSMQDGRLPSMWVAPESVTSVAGDTPASVGLSAAAAAAGCGAAALLPAAAAAGDCWVATCLR